MQGIDDFIVLWAQTIHSPALDVIAKILAIAGYCWFVIPLAYFIIKKRWTEAATVGLALVISFVSGTLILKNIIARTRPFIALGFTPISVPTGYSCPSGHTLVSFATGSSIWYLIRKQKAAVAWSVVVFVTLIALSRVYLGVHYPTDIVAGVAVGLLSAAAAVAIVKAVKKKLDAKAKN
ncbi:MAG: phosphatase PAP2 family protein [Eubacteriales bacterium]